jgi:predicted adenylyl cyclase CyaB
MTQTTPAINLEVKIRVPDLASLRPGLASLQPRSAGQLHQVDTYFLARHGRLKLRMIDGQIAQLISYDRPDLPGVRTSAYHIVPVPDPSALLLALTAALGVRCRVEKQRELYLWHNVRIHLDQVTGLGDFLELEAVLSPHDDAAISHDRLATVLTALGVSDSVCLGGSYADLLADAESEVPE